MATINEDSKIFEDGCNILAWGMERVTHLNLSNIYESAINTLKQNIRDKTSLEKALFLDDSGSSISGQYFGFILSSGTHNANDLNLQFDVAGQKTNGMAIINCDNEVLTEIRSLYGLSSNVPLPDSYIESIGPKHHIYTEFTTFIGEISCEKVNLV